MKKIAQLSVIAIMLSSFAFAAVVNAVELTEAQKKALETQLKAAELTKEATKTKTTTTTTAPVQAPEPVQVQNPEPGQVIQIPGVVTATSIGRVSAVSNNSITVGIIGENTFVVTPSTVVFYNGKPVLEPSLVPVTIANVFYGDAVTVTYDASTKAAIKVEAEGLGYASVVKVLNRTVRDIGMIVGDVWGFVNGVWAPLDPNFGMAIVGMYNGVFLNPLETQVTINGAPATVNDIRIEITLISHGVISLVLHIS